MLLSLCAILYSIKSQIIAIFDFKISDLKLNNIFSTSHVVIILGSCWRSIPGAGCRQRFEVVVIVLEQNSDVNFDV